jgi:hypothetical protein
MLLDATQHYSIQLKCLDCASTTLDWILTGDEKIGFAIGIGSHKPTAADWGQVWFLSSPLKRDRRRHREHGEDSLIFEFQNAIL